MEDEDEKLDVGDFFSGLAPSHIHPLKDYADLSSDDEAPSGPKPHEPKKAAKPVVEDDNEETLDDGLETQEAEDEGVVQERPTRPGGAASVEWADLPLSKPLQKAITKASYLRPTQVQGEVIPAALDGMDLCVRAVTGSGKTAAFVLPVLELCLRRYHSKKRPSVRALILVPTRELALQCENMIQQLRQFTTLSVSVITGGTPDNKQLREWLNQPDVIVATPGRIIDLLRNSKNPGINLHGLEILVLDEADKLLSMGFRPEIKEIMQHIQGRPQTLQFSATLTRDVSELALIVLKNPLHIDIGPLATAAQLRQEFVRIPKDSELQKEPYLLALLSTLSRGVIVFSRGRAMAHKLFTVCSLLRMQVAELHKLMTTAERMAALKSFREGHVKVLFCTDLAARGLDIRGARFVVNFDMPANVKTYIHRVGRTARLGEKGLAISLCCDHETPILQQVLQLQKISNTVKRGQEEVADICRRDLDAALVEEWSEKHNQIVEKYIAVRDEEAVATELAEVEREVKRAENITKFAKEIKERGEKSWFQSEKQKRQQGRKSKQEERQMGKKRSREEDEGETEAPPEKRRTQIKERKINAAFSRVERKLANKQEKRDEIRANEPNRLRKLTNMERKEKKFKKRKAKIEHKKTTDPKFKKRTERKKSGPKGKNSTKFKSHQRYNRRK
eukprot:TRINITY_DN30770_c0_g1_i1.p1 TRINITY_DN30770_c0_g1~~TRINITY_DN30770_c0_g1_i1.p1  ORF type:complete len:676 (-),score=132.33 TRINITY_DN30770_c0_g1_i1:46-2073(-)